MPLGETMLPHRSHKLTNKSSSSRHEKLPFELVTEV